MWWYCCISKRAIRKAIENDPRWKDIQRRKQNLERSKQIRITKVMNDRVKRGELENLDV